MISSHIFSLLLVYITVISTLVLRSGLIVAKVRNEQVSPSQSLSILFNKSLGPILEDSMGAFASKLYPMSNNSNLLRRPLSHCFLGGLVDIWKGLSSKNHPGEICSD